MPLSFQKPLFRDTRHLYCHIKIIISIINNILHKLSLLPHTSTTIDNNKDKPTRQIYYIAIVNVCNPRLYDDSTRPQYSLRFY